ncbi:MAG TPA: BTAD domain-containing putative transcriptional regulator [Longimicrobiales bacterium]|nr:BTAD domain-containing putative transcriptional regulator [Longimicrobiales bacterium]
MIRLEILGPGEALDGAGESLGLSGLPLALLAYLALTARPIERDELATLFWPGSDPTRRRHSLRQALSRIRSAVPDEVFETDGRTVSIDSMQVETDRDEFLEALSAGRVSDAVALWRGVLLEGFRREGAWELGEFLERERTRMQNALVQAVIERDDASDETELVLLEAAHRALPLEQPITARYAMALVRAGREAEAITLVPLEDEQDPRAAWPGVLAAAQAAQAASVRGRASSAAAPGDAVRATGPDGTGAGPFSTETRVGGRHSRFTSGLAAALVLGSATLGAAAIFGHSSVDASPATLFFCTDRAADQEGEIQLFRMDENGVDKHRVTTQPVCGVRPIAEDRLVGRSARADERRLRVLGPASDTSTSIAEWDILSMPELDTLTEVEALSVAYGATGPVVAFAARLPADTTREVFRWLPAEGKVERLTDHAGEDNHVDIAPDGSIVFRSVRSGDADVWVWSETEGARPLVTSPEHERDPQLRGDTLLFLRGRGVGADDGNIEVWLRELSTGRETRLTENDWNDYNVHWSPDGRYLCWQSEEWGHYEMDIVVQELATGRRWTIAGGRGRQSECHWDPGSLGVYYSDWEADGPEIYYTPLTGGTRVNLSMYPGRDGGLVVVPDTLFSREEGT